MLTYVLYTIFILACLVLVVAVLLQPGKADAGALFSSSVSSTAFGPRGTQTLLAKITIGAAAAFMLAALALAMPFVTGSRSVLQGSADPAQPQASPATPAASPAVSPAQGESPANTNAAAPANTNAAPAANTNAAAPPATNASPAPAATTKASPAAGNTQGQQAPTPKK